MDFFSSTKLPHIINWKCLINISRKAREQIFFHTTRDTDGKFAAKEAKTKTSSTHGKLASCERFFSLLLDDIDCLRYFSEWRGLNIAPETYRAKILSGELLENCFLETEWSDSLSDSHKHRTGGWVGESSRPPTAWIICASPPTIGSDFLVVCHGKNRSREYFHWKLSSLSHTCALEIFMKKFSRPRARTWKGEKVDDEKRVESGDFCEDFVLFRLTAQLTLARWHFHRELSSNSPQIWRNFTSDSHHTIFHFLSTITI